MNILIDLTDKSPDAMLETNTEFLTEQNCLGGAHYLLVMANLSMTSKTEKNCLAELFEIICAVDQ